MSPFLTDLAIIIDLLYYIHMPPPPDVVTFFEYFSFLWDCVFDRYKRYCKYLYIVIDKPQYLPHQGSWFMHLGKKGLVLLHTWILKLATVVQFPIVKHTLLFFLPPKHSNVN